MNTRDSRLRSLMATAALGLLLAVPCATPAAEGATVNLLRLDAFAADVPLGKTRPEAFLWLRSRIESAHSPQMKAALDDHDRNLVRTEIARDHGAVTEGVVPLTGERSGFEVSVISGEFATGSDEALLVYAEGAETHYLFFTGGRLWKYARALPAKGITFEARVARMRGLLGPPVTTPARDKAVGVRWTDERLRVRLVDRRVLFRADLLVVEQKNLLAVVASRRGQRAAEAPEATPDAGLEDFFDPEPQDDGDAP